MFALIEKLNQYPREDSIIWKAEQAFWTVIADSHPEIQTGNLDPASDIEFCEAMDTVYRRWLQQNREDD